jgi:hypothetical protein
MSRKSDFFHACKVDNEYIFEHTEYEWDDIMNAFMAGGIFADKNPKNPWIKIEPKKLEDLLDYSRYLVYKKECDEYVVLDGAEIKQTFRERKYTHVKLIEGPWGF